MNRRAGLLMTALLLSSGCDKKEMCSELWGRNGEKWDPLGRLPDYSYAGYHRGEKDLPMVSRPVYDVRTFGAKGDGKTDDTQAFTEALKSIQKGVLLIPGGRYILSDRLIIDRSHFVLRGEGPDKTVLHFARPLQEIDPKPWIMDDGPERSGWSWSGGLVTLRREAGYSMQITKLVAEAQRGDTRLEVAAPEDLSPAREVLIRQTDQGDKSLFEYLYANDPGNMSGIDWAAETETLVKIRRVDGNFVDIDRPLPVRIDLAWQPALYSAAGSVSESGIEDLSVAFPATDYKGYFHEVGWNGFAFETGTRNCWVRNVAIVNADSGIFLGGINNTARDIVITSQRKSYQRGGATGHHGLYFRGQDCLFEGFDIRTRFGCDISVSECSAGNVAMNGKAVKLSIDFHRAAPHSNLFTNIDAGYASRLFRRTGGRMRGKNAGAWNTIWNVRNATASDWPKPRYACPVFTVVGVEMNSVPPVPGWWYEDIPGQRLHPQNLYQAQLRRRLADHQACEVR